MKTRKLRLLSALLALAMLLALLPTAAFAEDTVYGTVSGVPSGNCGAEGDNLTWTLDGGTLTISGSGAMAEYENYNARPWVAYKNDIQKVVIRGEVTTIGKHAFEDCSQLSTVELPKNGKLKKIGFNAFGYLTPGSAPIITEIVIPNSVEEIAPYAFNHCTQLATVTFAPDSRLKNIGLSAFQYTAIEEIRIPASVEGLGTEPKYESGSAFFSCSNLKKVVFESPSNLNYVSKGNFSRCSENLIICCMDEKVIQKLTETGDVDKGNVDKDRIKPTYPTVTFDFDNGTEMKTEKVENGNTISAPAAPTKEGYVFDGWYTDVALTQKYDFSKPVIDDMTLYAKWEEVPVDTYVVTVENGVAWVEADAETEAVAAGESICVPEGVTVHVKADETAFDGMAFDRWEVRKGEVKLENDRAAETTFTMPAGEVQLEAMYQAADVHDSGWDAATVVTGVAIGTGTAILAYHIGMEVYAEQVLGKGVAVPRTRGEVALLAWQLTGSPAVNVEGEPLSEAAQAEKWAVESGLMQPDAQGNFNGTKKMSKWSALRTLDAAKKMG